MMARHASGSPAVLRRCVASPLGALLCLLAAAAVGAGENEGTFQFAPPDGTRYVETVDTTQVLDFGQGRTTSTRSQLSAQCSYRKLPDGYSVTSRMLAGQVEGPGQEGKQLMMEALKGVSLVYKIDATGRLVDVSGIEALETQLRETLPPEALALVGDVFSKENTMAMAQADWESHVLNYKGRSATPGSVWLATEHYPLPTGHMAEFHVAYKVTGEQTVDGRECARVEFRYASDPVELKGFVGSENESLLSGKAPSPGAGRVSGRGHRIVDPATLLPYGQKIERTIETTIAVPSQGDMAVTIRQDKKYWYSYQPAR